MHSPNIFLPVAACAAPPAPADLHKERGGAGGATDLVLRHLLHGTATVSRAGAAET